MKREDYLSRMKDAADSEYGIALRIGDQLFVQRLRKARGRPRLWQAFIFIDTRPTADVINRSVEAMTEEA